MQQSIKISRTDRNALSICVSLLLNLFMNCSLLRLVYKGKVKGRKGEYFTLKLLEIFLKIMPFQS